MTIANSDLLIVTLNVNEVNYPTKRQRMVEKIKPQAPPI